MRPATTPLPAADHGLIGDGHEWALVGRDGSIRHMSVSQDGDALVVDDQSFVITVEHLHGSRQYYLPDTNVLVTEMHGPAGVVEVTDAFTVRPPADRIGEPPVPRGELLRYLRVLEGHVTLCVESTFHVITDRQLGAPITVAAGEDLWFLLRWNDSCPPFPPERLIDDTAAAWRRWTDAITYQGPHDHMVRRSALLLQGISRSGSADAAAAFHAIGLVDGADVGDNAFRSQPFEPLREGHCALVRYGYLLVENLLGQGLVEQADMLYEALSATANSLGLHGERTNPATGRILDCFPASATHVAAITSAVALTKAAR